MNNNNLTLEAFLLASRKPQGLRKIASFLKITGDEAKKIINDLNAEYAAKHSFEIKSDKGKYSIVIRAPFSSSVCKIAPADISQDIKDLLVQIARGKAIRQANIVKQHGERTYELVKQLVEKGLILKQRDGNSYTLKPSEKFKQMFGVETARGQTETKKTKEEPKQQTIVEEQNRINEQN
ncbi:MAG: hypothetical protein CVU81_01525 [Euryarchaeota archaeon HGW-Euryarchaeota-1]|nr:MAG: hypothetical protein CVU81_01525 [Euryarchaeota archaeon HGW-Euryarchaeota-1]